MSQVDFYVLAASGELARQQFACRLAEKAYRLENKVHIQVANSESARRLDELLWTFRDGSFVPHEILENANSTANAKTQSPVTIGCDSAPHLSADLLINLGNTVPDTTVSFPRVAEVVTSDEDNKLQSRQRFAVYRDQGHTLKTHKL